MIIKQARERTHIGVFIETKERLDHLVKTLNKANRDALGKKAQRITADDVINELVSAYSKVGI